MKGDPVPFEHEFYRAHLQGLFSLDLTCAGFFRCRKGRVWTVTATE